MPKLLHYAYMAQAAYSDDRESLIARLQGNGCTGWSVRKWMSRTNSDGFQGAILKNDKEVVCTFKGSDPKKSFVKDFLVNDLQIVLGVIPNQTTSALELVKAAEKIANSERKPLSITGHSLGGGLAQVVGYARGLPFVTFNAPGMATNFRESDFTNPSAARGFNMILWSDFVGNFARHIGKTERFITPKMFKVWRKATGKAGFDIAHLMENIVSVLEKKPKWGDKKLDELV